MNETNQTIEIKTDANIGNRIIAGIVDYLIIYAFFFAFLYAFGEPNSDGGYSINGLPSVIPILFWGIMTVGIEQWFGATLGNSLVELKPVSIQGFKEKLTFGQSLKRHLLDPIDMFLFGLIGILTIKNTDKNQRLGDIWAHTIVIKNTEHKKTK